MKYILILVLCLIALGLHSGLAGGMLSRGKHGKNKLLGRLLSKLKIWR